MVWFEAANEEGKAGRAPTTIFPLVRPKPLTRTLGWSLIHICSYCTRPAPAYLNGNLHLQTLNPRPNDPPVLHDCQELLSDKSQIVERVSASEY